MRNFTLIAVLFSALSFSASATNYNNYGAATTYNLYAGDTLRIKSGTYTGTIAIFNNNAVIVVDPVATFKPNNIANSKGTIINNGNVHLNFSFTPDSGFDLVNFMTTRIRSIQMNTLVTMTNKFGAVLTVDQSIEMNAFSSLINEGSLNVGSSLTMNMFSYAENHNEISTGGALTVNFAEFKNEGELNTGGMLTLNFGAAFTNECRMITKSGFTNNTYSFTNLGLLWVGTSNTSADHFVNNTPFVNGPNAVVRAVKFTNNSTITGSGKMYFTGETINYGTIGVTGSTTDTIRVYDVSRTSPTRIFDIQYGSVRPNVVYRSFAQPDTLAMLGTCSNIFKAAIPLPVKWASFFVNLSNNTPVLNWASEQTPGTMFEIQRSYDGTNFSTIDKMSSVEGQVEYRYDDKAVNTQTPAVYYRIVGIELNGIKSYTETRVVKFSNKAGVTIQTAPNPFTSQFSINYQSTQNSSITIRLFNMSGQLQTSKTVSVTKGYNSIAVTGIATLSKGMYLVQILNENGIVATEKVVKQ